MVRRSPAELICRRACVGRHRVVIDDDLGLVPPADHEDPAALDREAVPARRRLQGEIGAALGPIDLLARRSRCRRRFPVAIVVPSRRGCASAQSAHVLAEAAEVGAALQREHQRGQSQRSTHADHKGNHHHCTSGGTGGHAGTLHPGVVDTVLAQNSDHLAGVDREEQALRVEGHQRVDPHDVAALVEQRPAAVAGIDGGVVLHGAGVERRALGRGHARDHAGGDGGIEGGRVLQPPQHLGHRQRPALDRIVGGCRKTHGHDIGELLGLVVADRKRLAGQVLVDPKDRQIEAGLEADDPRRRHLHLPPVAIDHHELGVLLDDVEVGDDGALPADQEARPGGALGGGEDLVDARLHLLQVEVVCVGRCRDRQQQQGCQTEAGEDAPHQTRSKQLQHFRPPRIHGRPARRAPLGRG